MGYDVGQSVKVSKGPYDAQLFCFENADIHKRDAILNAAKGYPGADVKRQSPLNNASVAAVGVASRDCPWALQTATIIKQVVPCRQQIT